MIRITQLKLPITHKQGDIKRKASKLLRIQESSIKSLTVVKQSVDARKKDQILYSYTVDVEAGGEETLVHKAKNPNIQLAKPTSYRFCASGKTPLRHRPVIIGCGPAGLFAGLLLARHGYAPILLERGEDVDQRRKKVENFWREGSLDGNSNVQFGEGGAGTFSDGKLNTLVKDPFGRNQEVLRILAEAGADPAILIVNKPHIGTDVLGEVVKTMRKQIVDAGGEVRFQSCVTDFIVENRRVTGVVVNGEERLLTDAVILAIGHSARDTFETLSRTGADMEQKAFAVGLRIQHPQKMINLSQYGKEEPGVLGAASYKLACQGKNGRGIYSFCMCPGGYVVNASSEAGRLAVNGMSYHGRAGENANSALIVTVTPKDFPDATPLAGVHFQQKLEEAAYKQGSGKIPIQLYQDFRENKESREFGDVHPAFRGGFAFANLRRILPDDLSDSLVEGIEAFQQQIRGFSRPDAILAGVESRTSSPVRICRDSQFESSLKGLYPCGEGAGYAGGITSAAMDGLKVAEALAREYAPF